MATVGRKTAPGTKVKPPTSWSFSRYGDYKTCPLKFKLKHLDKISEPKSDAMQRGIDAHNQAEAYVKGEVKVLDPILVGLKSEFDAMRKLYKAKKFPMIVEDNWAFDVNWDETQWNNWADCWVRIKLDAAHYTSANEMMVTDWKTGKPNDFKNAEYMEQLELYAVSALLMSAAGDELRVRVRLGFTETGDIIYPMDSKGQEIVYMRKDLVKLKKLWDDRVRPMMSDTTFAPRANNTCKWCWFGQSKAKLGGPGLCKY